jgi:protein ImuA
MPLARAELESLLRARRLDRTLASLPPLPSPGDDFRSVEYAVAPSGVAALDGRLAGGFPRGQLCELAGPHSSGRTSLMLCTLAAATARDELVAVIDALDRLDATSAEGAGIDLGRLLWVRGHVKADPGLSRDQNARALEQAIKAAGLVLAAGNFGLVVLDLAETPLDALRRLPFTTWLRLQRLIEGTQTVCLLVAAHPIARSSAGVTLHLHAAACGGGRFSARLFDGLDIDARVVGARACRLLREDVCVSFSTGGW